ncbi:MAG: hypothetical protein ACRDQZ_19820 [Mycobacteriales bacterium]
MTADAMKWRLVLRTSLDDPNVTALEVSALRYFALCNTEVPMVTVDAVSFLAVLRRTDAASVTAEAVSFLTDFRFRVGDSVTVEAVAVRAVLRGNSGESVMVEAVSVFGLVTV